MIFAYCRYCGGQYTTLDANVSDSGAKRNQCLQCGRRLDYKRSSKWSSLFTTTRFNIDQEALMIMQGVGPLPDVKPDTFRTAFQGFMAEHDGGTLLRASISYGVDTTPYRMNPASMRKSFGIPFHKTETPVKRKTCLMSDTYRPDILYVTTSSLDAIRIRYYVTDVDGIPPAVMFISGQMYSSAFAPLLNVCNPNKVILCTTRAQLRKWSEAGNPCDLFYEGTLGSPIYFATRAMEDELERPSFATVDPDTGKLRMASEQLIAACASVSVDYVPKTPSSGYKKMPSMSAAPKYKDSLCRAVYRAKRRKGNSERTIIP